MLITAHRFLLALLAVLVLAPPAGAAEVARNGDDSLDVRDGRSPEVCIEVRQARGGSGTCGRAPLRERRSVSESFSGSRGLVAGGVVPAAVARAEAELSDGRRVAVDTVAGERYRGRYAGRLRFFLISVRGFKGDLVVTRFFKADGTLSGVAPGAREGASVGSRKALLREQAGRRSITVVAQTQRRITPTPRQLDRSELLTCLTSTSRTGSFGSSSSTLCHDASPRRLELLVIPEPGCGGLRTVLFGFVGDAVTAVRVRLGSGRVRQVRARTLTDAQGGTHRYIATPIARGEAIRSVSAVGGVEAYDLHEPPGGLPCLSSANFVVSYGFVGTYDEGGARPASGDEQVAAESDGHRLLVRDGPADRLCSGIDRLLANESDCLLPAAVTEEAYGLARGGMVAAVLPAEATAVRLPDGRVVPTVEGAYTGRYAGTVRFLLARSTAGLTDRFRALDASGAVIGPVRIFDLSEIDNAAPVSKPVPLARGRGWRLSAARISYGACAFLTLRGGEPECVTGLAKQDGAFAAVGCTPKVAVLTGSLARRTRSVRAELRGGRLLRARIVRVPKRLGGGRQWVLALPRRARVEWLRFDGRRTRFPLLPAAKQCGYRLYAPGIGGSFGVAEPELEVIR